MKSLFLNSKKYFKTLVSFGYMSLYCILHIAYLVKYILATILEKIVLFSTALSCIFSAWLGMLLKVSSVCISASWLRSVHTKAGSAIVSWCFSHFNLRITLLIFTSSYRLWSLWSLQKCFNVLILIIQAIYRFIFMFILPVLFLFIWLLLTHFIRRIYILW